MKLSGIQLFALVIVLGLVVSACDDSPQPGLTTTSSLISNGGNEIEATTTTTQSDSTPTSIRGEVVADYEVIDRIPTETGETLHIVIPPGAYTDVDLENFIHNLIDSGAVAEAVEVFDDQAAAAAYLVPEAQRTTEEQALVEAHHLISLIDHDRIRFQGPFASFGEYVIGS